MIRVTPSLRHLDAATFPGLKPDATFPPDRRDEFYVCNSFLQLVENVYADLDLERHWQHPHAEGWMRVFRGWAKHPTFRRAWRIAEPTYAERFRNFYNDRLQGGFPLVVSHRGNVSGPIQGDNSPATMLLAAAAGADLVEFDVRALLDGELVVAHDAARDGLTLAGHTRTALKGQGVEVVGLEECLRALQGEVHVNLELKEPGIVDGTLSLLRQLQWDRRTWLLTSFDRDVVGRIRRLNPAARVGLLLDTAPVSEYDSALEFVAKGQVDYLLPEATMLSGLTLNLALEWHVRLMPWTVNDPVRLRQLMRHRAVAGVITDNPGEALAVRSAL